MGILRGRVLYEYVYTVLQVLGNKGVIYVACQFRVHNINATSG